MKNSNAMAALKNVKRGGDVKSLLKMWLPCGMANQFTNARLHLLHQSQDSSSACMFIIARDTWLGMVECLNKGIGIYKLWR